MRVSILSSNTLRLYFVTNTKCTCIAKAQCLPVLISLDTQDQILYLLGMLIRKAYKFKIKTNQRECILFSQWVGCVRLVWNKSLALQKSNCNYINQEFARLGGLAIKDERQRKAMKKDLYKQHFPSVFDITTKALVPIWKKSEDLWFLNDCPAQALQKPLADLGKAFFKCFNKTGGFPRFKKKGDRDSIHFPQGFKVKGNKVFLPKIGWIKFFKSRDIEGVIKNVTVTSDGFGNWFASFCTEDNREVMPRKDGELGIDLGITNFAALSDGALIKKPTKIKQLMHAKKKLVKSLGRKNKGSKNRETARVALVKTERKITNSRYDFLQKTSSTISKNHALVAVEDLRITNMSKSAKGTKERPGKNVRAKSGLNREILACGWGYFKNMLSYKQMYSGGVLVSISPKNTSRKCSCCGIIDAGSRVRQEWYACIHCGHEIHADTNAAINILAAGRVAVGDINNTSCLAHESSVVI